MACSDDELQQNHTRRTSAKKEITLRDEVSRLTAHLQKMEMENEELRRELEQAKSSRGGYAPPAQPNNEVGGADCSFDVNRLQFRSAPTTPRPFLREPMRANPSPLARMSFGSTTSTSWQVQSGPSQVQPHTPHQRWTDPQPTPSPITHGRYGVMH